MELQIVHVPPLNKSLIEMNRRRSSSKPEKLHMRHLYVVNWFTRGTCNTHANSFFSFFFLDSLITLQFILYSSPTKPKKIEEKIKKGKKEKNGSIRPIQNPIKPGKNKKKKREKKGKMVLRTCSYHHNHLPFYATPTQLFILHVS